MIIIQQPDNSTSSHIFSVDGAPQNKLIVPSQVRPIFSECSVEQWTVMHF